MVSGQTKYRRSPHLVLYWRGEQLLAHNYRAGTVIEASASTVRVLDAIRGWRSKSELSRDLGSADSRTLDTVLSKLVRSSLVECSAPKPDSTSDSAAWREWSPVAAFFHFATKDVNYVADTSGIRKEILGKLRRSTPPPAVKKYRGVPTVELPSPSKDGELPEVLLRRRTFRRFGRESLHVAQLATLLGLTFGVQRWMDMGELGYAPLKTSPSGGARHPVEAYLVVRRVEGLPAGLYHYRPDRHRLERLPGGANRKTITAFLAGQEWYGSASALVLMTALFSRKSWHYPHPRAYRSVLLEAGHLCQTFCLVATWLRLAPFCSAALADSRIERRLGIDGVSESVLYAAGVGTRPPGTDWAPLPDRPGRPDVRTNTSFE